VCVCVCVIE